MNGSLNLRGETGMPPLHSAQCDVQASYDARIYTCTTSQLGVVSKGEGQSRHVTCPRSRAE